VTAGGAGGKKLAGFPVTLGSGAKPSRGGDRTLVRPQRLLHEAAQDARRHNVPAGLGLDSAAVRAHMVHRLRAQGIAPEAVLEAMNRVPRHLFVDAALATQAYEDTSLPIGLQQTISKPSVVARMASLLLAGAGATQRGDLGRVLEIGTGCGYQAAVLSLLARDVVSIERLRALCDKASVNLRAWGEGCGIDLVYADGTQLGQQGRLFDSIISAAGGQTVPEVWLAQLAEGGRLVAPTVGPSGQQLLCVVDKANGQLKRTLYEPVHFVPLKSGVV
jgi:protein-L-isoaspartate(D-aspartate) O-methyltransferase